MWCFIWNNSIYYVAFNANKFYKKIQIKQIIAFILSVNNHFFLGTMALWIILLMNDQDNEKERMIYENTLDS